jgi:hypothetical protein
VNRRPRLEIVAPGASPAEAAAVVAALERFMRETAPPRVSPPPAGSPWGQTGLSEGTGDEVGEPTAWGDPEPWRRGG